MRALHLLEANLCAALSMSIDQETLDLLNELVSYWKTKPGLEHYYSRYRPQAIVRSPDHCLLDDYEQPIVSALRQRMSEEDWHRLPDFLSALPQYAEILTDLQHLFQRDFLAADGWILQRTLPKGLFSQSVYQQLKAEFVQNWALQELEETLDLQQATAVATVHGNVLVTARAGSGKTRTLVTRAIFLQKHCGVSPREILLLAFNADAAKEMKRRLQLTLGDDLPHVMTFHALAHALVRPDGDLLSDDEDAGRLGLSKELQRVVEGHIQGTKYNPHIRTLMLSHFRRDWHRIVDGQLLTPSELVGYRRALPRATLGGDVVVSWLEKTVANALFEHGVPYSYKPRYQADQTYRSDFSIRGHRVIIECFGSDDEHDDQGSREAPLCRPETRSNGWTIIKVARSHLQSGEQAFVSELLAGLQETGVRHRQLSEDEIWQRVRPRAIDQFTEAIRSFVAKCRSKNITVHQLTNMRKDRGVPLDADGSETIFLDVAESIYAQYLKVLRARALQDFSGLVWEAVSLVRAGQSTFVRDRRRERGDLSNLKSIMIDEFQDFSQMFYELINAIRQLNPSVDCFCVGDDWQAINAFAGSELCFFQRFEDFFGDTVRLELTTNYRSVSPIVEIGNALMHGKGTEAQSSSREHGSLPCLGDIDRFQPTSMEDTSNGSIVPPVLRLVWHLIGQGQGVAILSRRNKVDGFPGELDEFLNHIRARLPFEQRQRVSASTVHKFKGQEQDSVILLDANSHCYPLIHPNWVFMRIFGDSPEQIEQEERRLFYVALTRARKSLVVLTNSTARSPYIDTIKSHSELVPLSWNELSPILRPQDDTLEIRVITPHLIPEIIGQLKEHNYRWSGKYWIKKVPQAGFSWSSVCGQPWATQCRIEVYSPLGNLVQKWPED